MYLGKLTLSHNTPPHVSSLPHKEAHTTKLVINSGASVHTFAPKLVTRLNCAEEYTTMIVAEL